MPPALPRPSVTSARVGAARRPRALLAGLLAVLTLALGGFASPARAEVQFDVFFGFDDSVREGNWFPVAFEIFNDGPSFVGTVVLAPEENFGSQRRVFTIELPTGTRKRTVIPVFPTTAGPGGWEARLLDADGNVVAERTPIQPKRVPTHLPLLGALPRSFGGLPTFPRGEKISPSLETAVARLQEEYLPANPIALQGMSALYLNSESATRLRPEQVDAILTWVFGGGHLIVGIEQPGDVNGLPWLAGILPFQPESIVEVPADTTLHDWLVTGEEPIPSLAPPGVGRRGRVMGPANRPVPVVNDLPELANPYESLAPDLDFAAARMPIVAGKMAPDTRVLAASDGAPLIMTSPRGRGAVTVLAFSPEREPYRSWKNRAWMWAKLTPLPRQALTREGVPQWSSVGVDGLFGAMLDSRQVRKLPVAALLLLLVVYLVVIGPFDQWILRKLNRQMWTWVTFPIYLILFSGLIYFIGYRLRAGELEWNELQVVDQLPRGEQSLLSGRTWISIYSPANARYKIASEQPFATFRGEHYFGGAGREGGRLMLEHPPRGFQAEAFVPVWVSQLYASDWMEPSATILNAEVEPLSGSVGVKIHNASSLQFSSVKVAYDGRLYNVGELKPGERIAREISMENSTPLDALGHELLSAITAAQQRLYAFGGAQSGQRERDLDSVILASLGVRSARAVGGGQHFASPNGFDLSHLLERNQAIVFAWAGQQAIAAPIHRFSPRRMQRDTVVRVALSAASRP